MVVSVYTQLSATLKARQATFLAQWTCRGQQMVRADDAGTKTPIQKSLLLFCKPPKWTA